MNKSEIAKMFNKVKNKKQSLTAVYQDVSTSGVLHIVDTHGTALTSIDVNRFSSEALLSMLKGMGFNTERLLSTN